MADRFKERVDDSERYGQPHDFMNPEKRCKCGLSKITFDSLSQAGREAAAMCRLPHKPRT